MNGVPVIVSKAAPWSKVVEKNCGWWVDLGVDALVSCLDEALSRPEQELSKMGEEGRKWVLREFATDKLIQMFIETYDWVLSGGDRPAWIHL